MRSPVSATAEPANSIQTTDARRIVFMASSQQFRPIERRAVAEIVAFRLGLARQNSGHRATSGGRHISIG
jgi:hypothetical protein